MADLDQEFLDFVVKSLVDHPDDIKVERTVDEMGVLLTLKTNPEDMGQIIGRSGNTARAIRTLLRVVGAKNNARVNLKIYEPEGSNRSPRRDDRGSDRRDDRGSFRRDDRFSAPRQEETDTSAVDDLRL
ncbi:KH domain-containing protein [Patescibacteria group bacterium]|nr:KH domain-containing protein [Patescibacteria group bacterium]